MNLKRRIEEIVAFQTRVFKFVSLEIIKKTKYKLRTSKLKPARQKINEAWGMNI